MRAAIEAGLAQLGLDPGKGAALARYGALLLERNRVMNLTAITQPEDVATLHMLDCAALCAGFDLAGKRFIDVGTGAGFPGLVVAILRPDCAVTLLDPLEKRLRFIQEVIEMLGLSNVKLLHARGEDAGRTPELRQGFDLAGARAVAPLPVLAELCLPFVRVGGRFLAMKGVDSQAELEGARALIQQLGGQPEEPWDYAVPGCQVVHRVWPIRKAGPTPEEFPRRWAKIRKNSGNFP